MIQAPGVALVCLLLVGAVPAAPSVPGRPVRCINYADEVVVYVRDLDLLRASARELTAEVTLSSDAGEDRYEFDLTAPWQTPALVMRKRPGARYSTATVALHTDGGELYRATNDLGEPIQPRAGLPLSGERAVIEPGMADVEPPEILQPDLSALRKVTLHRAERVVRSEDITACVETDINYPLVSANNNCAISLQTAHPDDPARRSLYVPLKSQLFDPDTGAATEVAHYLVEVPLDEAWLEGEGDLAVSLPPQAIRVHTSDATWPPDDPQGIPILGNGASGLGQLVGTVAVDEEGRIYYSHVPAGVVRFDPRTGRYEVPPIDIDAHFAQFLPSAEDIPDEIEHGRTEIRWEGYKIIAVSRGRLFYAPIINAVYRREDYTAFVFAGLMSMPVDHWDDPAAFSAATRFHVGSWPGCEHSFFAGWPDPNDRTRKLGRLFPREDDLYITAYRRQWGGPWKLEFDEDGDTISFGVVTDLPAAPRGLRRDSASGLADWRSYGSITLSRQALATILHGVSSQQPEGTIEIFYDAIAAMRLDPERYGALLAASSGPSLAPVYMAAAVPDRADMVLGVAEYGYYLATFDLSRLGEGLITKRYLLRDAGHIGLELPLPVGLGPYGYTWWRDGDSLYLYMSGYTGLTRLVYQSPDLPPGRYRMEDITHDIEVNTLDAAGPGPIKRFRYLQPGLDGRIFLTGTHTAARGGTAYSGGLMSFVADRPDVLDKISFMSRCYWTTHLESRVVYAPETPPTQQFFLGGGSFDEGYAFTLDPELVPADRDPKIFVYDYVSGGAPRSLYGFSMPPGGEQGGYCEHRFDRTRRYLIVIHGSSLLTFDVAGWRYVDGLTLVADGPVRIAEFERPDRRLLRTPDDRLVMYVTVGDNPTEGTFLAVEVAEDGAVSVQPLLTLIADDLETFARTVGVVATFVPDLRAGDGSCDLLLGVPFRRPGTRACVIRDFIEPRR